MTALRSVPDVSTHPAASKARWWAGTGVFLVALVVLFAAYLRLSSTYPENSDEANILLMASDLAHGNLYLSGWNVSDVPFITTELPEIALLVKLFGLHLDTAHIAAALTYTVVVAISVLLASGRADRRRSRFPLVRMGIALAIMLAPQPGVGVFAMIFSVGHIGTAAPVMITWLVLDRFCCLPGERPPVPAKTAIVSGARMRGGPEFPRRLWVLPVTVGVLLAWALMADSLVLVIAICPVLAVGALRVVPGLITAIRNGGGLRQAGQALATRWLEASLVAAAGLAYLVAWCGQRLLRAAGGYTQQPVPFTLDPVGTWYGHARIAAHGLLEMFGAFPLPGNAINYLGPGNYVAAPPLSGLAEAVAVTRLACVALAILGACAIARRFFRRDADLVSQLLLAGIVANLAAYIPSSLAGHTALNAREFAPVLPFAAVLAARTLGDRLGDRLYRPEEHSCLPGGRPPVPRRMRARWQKPPSYRARIRPLPGGTPPVPPDVKAPGLSRAAGRTKAAGLSRVRVLALVALLGWYGFGLFQEARIPAAPNPFARLEAFLKGHHLTDGIGGYWNSSVITVDTGGAITIRAVTRGCLQPYAWESKPAWYDPATRTASFVLESSAAGYFSQWQASPAALRQLGTLLPALGRATRGPGAGYVHAYQGNLLTELPLLARC